MNQPAGEVLFAGKYRLYEPARRGAFGEVYRATHLKLNVERAIKIFQRTAPGVSSQEFLEYQQRFSLEAQLGAILEHPNIIKVYDFEDTGEQLYLVMEYAPGGSLQERLKDGRLSVEESVRLLADVCCALEVLHQHDPQVVHRDIKPSNILFASDGRARLCDLGLAQIPDGQSLRVKMGSLAQRHPGTPEYMSPEQQYTLAYLQPTSDIYSLGCVLFEALSGKLYQSVYGSRLSEWLPGTPGWLDELLQRMLEQEPGLTPADDLNPRKRYRMASQVRADLQRHWQAEIAHREQQRASKEQEEQKAEEQRNKEQQKRRAQEQAQNEQRKREEEQRQKEREQQRIIQEQAQPKSQPATPTATTGKTRLLWLGVPVGIVALILMVALVVILGVRAVQWLQDQQGQPIAEATRNSLIVTQPPPPGAAVGAAWESPVDGAVMRYIPAGSFRMGSEEGDDDEKPVHAVTLDGYWLDETEVTNERFARFVKATGYQTTAEKEGSGWVLDEAKEEWKITEGANWQQPRGPGSSIAGMEKHPVVQVSWDDAVAYCEWAGKRLPTEAEWEKAARGTDGRKYPWGNAAVTGRLANYADVNLNVSWADKQQNDGYQYTAPVGSYPAGASPYGLLDMAGNVWEWVADWFSETYYGSSPGSNPQGPASGEYRALRGGGWYLNVLYLRSAYRNGDSPTYRLDNLGFRCARSP